MKNQVIDNINGDFWAADMWNDFLCDCADSDNPVCQKFASMPVDKEDTNAEEL